MRAYTKYAKAIPGAARQIRANLRPPLAPPVLERGLSAFKGFADFFRADVPAIFKPVNDAALQAEFKEANTAAASAMRELADWLESQRATATGNFALGAERFAQMLSATERVTTPLADLEAAGRADLERNQKALQEACAKFAPGAPIPRCIAKMSANKAAGGAVAGARAQLKELNGFVETAGFARRGKWASATTIPKRTSANSRTRCCATRGSSRPARCSERRGESADCHVCSARVSLLRPSSSVHGGADHRLRRFAKQSRTQH